MKVVKGEINIVNEYIKKLEQENKQLKEALETKYYCQYANKCNELYDCTREEYETMTLNNMKLSLENAVLLEKIDKAIKYIKENNKVVDITYISNKATKELLEILGDKENDK